MAPPRPSSSGERVGHPFPTPLPIGASVRPQENLTNPALCPPKTNSWLRLCLYNWLMLIIMIMQWAWRMSTSGFLKEPEPIAISSMWRLPRQLDVIDAIFERPGDGVVVIFRGRDCFSVCTCISIYFGAVRQRLWRRGRCVPWLLLLSTFHVGLARLQKQHEQTL